MATPQMKAQAVLWYAEFKSIIRVQREFRRVFNRDAPTARSIKKWRDTLLATGSVLKKHGGGRRASDEMVANVQAAFERSPRKSLRRASRELQIPKSTLQRIVHKRLKLHAYKVQLVQRLEPNDIPKRAEFANTMLDRLGADPDFMTKIFFSDEATFHLSGKVNRHNVRIWGSENPHAIQEHVRDSPKMNVWCSLSHNKALDRFSSPRKLFVVPHILTCWSSSSFHKLNNCSLTSFSSKMVLLPTGPMKFVRLWTTFSLAVGLVGEDQSRGPRDLPI
ncbi:hypothetical protein L9F63_009365 [Diploptera punctata]|uniref:DUF4817 domain-containing protein n=1 Tax=Diploptera punctata TaxID=6984 RepID=A0AAD8AJQ6_DIPPU|nr:hypothetical protein L9F63_009365 [Diploptera punctata]